MTVALHAQDNVKVVLNLPRRLVTALREDANRRRQSLSELVTDRLGLVLPTSEEGQAAVREAVADEDYGWDLGTGGIIPYTREELHERS